MELAQLIAEGRVMMIGAVRQEVLSGIQLPEQYRKLRTALRAFPDAILETSDFEEAANCFNRCRGKGVQGSNTDFLLCAVALRFNVALLTTDADFDQFAKVLRLKLHRPRVGLS